MSQTKEEFDVNEAIRRANTMLNSMDEGTPSEASDKSFGLANGKNLMLATIIHKLVGAACAWKATRMTDVAADLAQGLQQDMGTTVGHTQAANLVNEEDAEDEGSPPRTLEDLKDKLGLKRKVDKRW